jgi:hypothetical protein
LCHKTAGTLFTWLLALNDKESYNAVSFFIALQAPGDGSRWLPQFSDIVAVQQVDDLNRVVSQSLHKW